MKPKAGSWKWHSGHFGVYLDILIKEVHRYDEKNYRFEVIQSIFILNPDVPESGFLRIKDHEGFVSNRDSVYENTNRYRYKTANVE